MRKIMLKEREIEKEKKRKREHKINERLKIRPVTMIKLWKAVK